MYAALVIAKSATKQSKTCENTGLLHRCALHNDGVGAYLFMKKIDFHEVYLNNICNLKIF